MNRLIVFTSFILMTTFAHANEEWVFGASTYIWASGQKGEVATLPPYDPIEIDVSVDDIINDIDMSLTGLFEARKGRYGVFAEVFVLDIEINEKGTYSEFTYEESVQSASFGGSYRWRNERIIVDALLGVRYWVLDNTSTLRVGTNPTVKVSHKEEWLDPMLGIKPRILLNDKWSIGSWVFVAVGGDSDKAVDLYAGVNYKSMFGDYPEYLISSGGARFKVFGSEP